MQTIFVNLDRSSDERHPNEGLNLILTSGFDFPELERIMSMFFSEVHAKTPVGFEQN
jgi:hypothetical protein